jgi:hypothetical protein
MKQNNTEDELLAVNRTSLTVMISLTGFAKQMNVCVNTVRSWIANGKLEEGKHFSHIGNIYRFPWSDSYVEKLMQSLAPHPAKPRPLMKSRQKNRTHIKLRA